MPPDIPTSKLLNTSKIPTQISNLHYRHCIHGYSRISNIAIEEQRIALTYSADAGEKRAWEEHTAERPPWIDPWREDAWEPTNPPTLSFFHRRWMQAHQDLKWTLWAWNPDFLVLIPKPGVRSLRASRFFLGARTEIGPTCPMTQSARSEPITALRSVVSINPRALIGSTVSADVDLVGPPAPQLLKLWRKFDSDNYH